MILTIHSHRYLNRDTPTECLLMFTVYYKSIDVLFFKSRCLNTHDDVDEVSLIRAGSIKPSISQRFAAQPLLHDSCWICFGVV